jgi:hypothetical protein
MTFRYAPADQDSSGFPTFGVARYSTTRLWLSVGNRQEAGEAIFELADGEAQLRFD